MVYFVSILLYCLACVITLIFVRRRNKKKASDSNQFGIINWIVLVFIAPLGIVLSPFWIPFILIPHMRENIIINEKGKEWKERAKEWKKWKKERKKRVIIGRGDVSDEEVASISVFVCENCGYTVRSEPQGFYALKSEMYYNFRCNSCKNVVNISSVDIKEMGYVPTCPLCDSRRISFWNPIEGHCPKCKGKMKMEKTT